MIKGSHANAKKCMHYFTTQVALTSHQIAKHSASHINVFPEAKLSIRRLT